MKYLLVDKYDEIITKIDLGDESFGKFYTGNGFIALNNIINNEPELLQNIKIIDEQGKSYSITKFLDNIKKLKIVLD